MAKDLRTYIDELRQAGLLLEIQKPVCVDTQAGALNWRAVKERRNAVLCENLVGFPGWRSVSGIMGTRDIAAVALGCGVRDMTSFLVDKMDHGGLVPSPVVETGPVHDIVELGEAVDLLSMPFHVVSEGDAGRYMGSGFIVTRDPDTGIRNLSVHRHQVKGKDKLGVMIAAGKHLGRIYEKYRERGEPMPVAIVNGHHGAVVMASTWTSAYGVDEYEIANMLLGERMNLVKCKTVDLEVPAAAELVIEGLVPTDVLEEEGPFGEHTGCTIAGEGLNPIVQVSAVTRRKDAIFLQITEGPDTDGAVLDALPMEVQLYKRVRDVGGGPDIRQLVVHESAGGGHVVIIQMVPKTEGETKAVLMAALSSEYLHPKIAVTVDEDVDPYDPRELLWSLSTKVNPHDDVFIINGTPGHSLDASLPRISPYEVNPVIRVGSRMGIDACKPPLSQAAHRKELARLWPKGYADVRLEDFLGD